MAGEYGFWINERRKAEENEKKYHTCSCCNGTGMVQKDTVPEQYDYNFNDYVTCPRCNGTGKVD